MKKIISIALALLMVAVMLPVMAMAAEVSDEATLKDAVAAGGDIKLANDIKLTETLVVNTTVVLDMNGHKLYNDEDIWEKPNKGNWSLVSVRGNGNLTITGNGTLKAKENDCFAADVYDAGAVLTIENGTFIGNAHAIYIYDGTAYIKGGTYSIQQKSSVADKPYEFVLNCYDANRVAGTAKMYVTGGTFHQFNPANNAAEGMKTNFAGDSLVINNGEFCVGNDAMNVISNTSAGRAVRIVNGNNISGVPTGVIIYNETGHGITVNGDNVPPYAGGDGDNNGYVVPNQPIIIYTPDNEPAFLSGANQVVAPGAAATFRIDEEYDRLLAVAVDGVTLDKSNYEAWSGSTYIKLLPKFMKTLSVGTHTLTAYFTSHTVSTTFTISEGAKNPATGANDFVGVAAAMAVVSLLGAAAVIRKK